MYVISKQLIILIQLLGDRCCELVWGTPCLTGAHRNPSSPVGPDLRSGARYAIAWIASASWRHPPLLLAGLATDAPRDWFSSILAIGSDGLVITSSDALSSC